jgi:tryptophan synthase alpha chain
MGIERIAAAFQSGRKAFMPYSVLGYPDRETSLQVIRTLVSTGADLLELGVSFSDPLADGPTIQAATQQALENGISLQECIQMAASLRAEGVQTPAVLMSYVNPIFAYGVERCVRDSAAAGVDGFIVPDLPPEEDEELAAACLTHGLALIYLLAPTSPPERIRLVAQKSRGFIYLVSVTGVTGSRQSLPEHLADFVARVRSQTSLPLAVGFGISTGEQARSVAALADGVIVGSALVRCAGESVAAVRNLAEEMCAALHESP